MRREIIVSGTVKASINLEQGVAVSKNGAVVSSPSVVPFGFTLDKVDAGVHVAVVRLGFAPVIRAASGGAFGDQIAATTAGAVATATTAGRVVGTLQGANSGAGTLAPAWINCLDATIF